MFLVNSRQGIVRCGPACAGQSLSLSYGHFFAEFLQELSPVHLSALTLTHLCRFSVRIPSFLTLKSFSGKSARPRCPGRTQNFPHSFPDVTSGSKHGCKSNNTHEVLLFVSLSKKGGRAGILTSCPSLYTLRRTTKARLTLG